jgi:hypothetical protein
MNTEYFTTEEQRTQSVRRGLQWIPLRTFVSSVPLR